MRILVCRDCGKRYDYDKDDFCPKCGSYNPPRDDPSTPLEQELLARFAPARESQAAAKNQQQMRHTAARPRTAAWRRASPSAPLSPGCIRYSCSPRTQETQPVRRGPRGLRPRSIPPPPHPPPRPSGRQNAGCHCPCRGCAGHPESRPSQLYNRRHGRLLRSGRSGGPGFDRA